LFHEAFFREIVGIKIYFPRNYKNLLSPKFFLRYETYSPREKPNEEQKLKKRKEKNPKFQFFVT
jgi:hypothetical protein